MDETTHMANQHRLLAPALKTNSAETIEEKRKYEFQKLIDNVCICACAHTQTSLGYQLASYAIWNTVTETDEIREDTTNMEFKLI